MAYEHINNLEQIYKIDFNKKLTFSMQGIMFIVIIIIIGFLTWNFRRGKTYSFHPKHTSQNLPQESKVNLKEGGVTLDTPPTIKGGSQSFALYAN